MPDAAPYPADTRAKGWRFELDHERIRQSDTWALSPRELRPWLLMLWMVAWEQTPCGSLPDDDALIAARLDMAPKAFERARAVLLRGWWQADDGRLYHAVMTERVAAMLAKRAKDAKRAADSRANHAPVTSESRVTKTGVRPEFDTKHQAPEEKKTPPPPKGGALPGFNAFWNAYPSNDRKVAKRQCYEKWQRRSLESLSETIVAAVEAMKRSARWQEENGRYVPAPLVYLNQDRWEAEAPPIPSSEADLAERERKRVEKYIAATTRIAA